MSKAYGRGGRKHRGNRRAWHEDRNPEEGTSSDGPPRKQSHPKHLRGREIGLWHARKKKVKGNDEVKMMGKILLPEAKQKYLQSILDKTIPTTFKIDGGNYDHVANSKFKKNFLETINGNIEMKLDAMVAMSRNEILDRKFKDEFTQTRESPVYMRMLPERRRLPAYRMKKEIMDMIENNQIVIISGETGCGKTTQVAQFILDHYLENEKGSLCRVVCTQPRRISAISVAERVADERGEDIGHSVGFQIRLEKKMPRDKGSILFCTTGVVLKQMENEAAMRNVSHLILDEIHERDVMSDFLIALMAKVIKKRTDLRVILMSATLNAQKFAYYFSVDSIIEIPGFTYDVTEYYLEDVILRTGFQFPSASHQSRKHREIADHTRFIMPHVRNLELNKLYPRSVVKELMNPTSEQINLELVLELLISICQKEKDPGAILVFLTGYNEILKLNGLMEDSKKFPKNRYLIIPLHSQMPTVEQRFIFRPPPSGVRKIILSTNIAETSITIDDVVFVIDCGKIKMNNFNVETNQETLNHEWVSHANANQRRGRAGRVKPGICFHLFSKARKAVLESYQKPEILRKRLEDVILMLKLLQLGSAKEFLNSLMDPPGEEAIDIALNLLKRLNALDDDESVTPLGYHLAKLPMNPQIGKMILMGAIFSCLNPILSIAVSLDFKDAFQLPMDKQRTVDQKKVELAKGIQSDHIILFNAMDMFETVYNQNQFCWEYYLSHSTMKLLCNMKQQFAGYLHELNFIPESNPKCTQSNLNSHNTSLIKAIICAGLYPNVVLNRSKIRGNMHINRFTTLNLDTVKLHPKSVLNHVATFDSLFLVYFLKIKSTSDFVHDATVVSPLSLLFFGDKYAQNEVNGNISINGSLGFTSSHKTGSIIKELRDRLNWFLEHKVSHPGFVDWSNDEEVVLLRAIMDLITIEEIGLLDFNDDVFNDINF